MKIAFSKFHKSASIGLWPSIKRKQSKANEIKNIIKTQV